MSKESKIVCDFSDEFVITFVIAFVMMMPISSTVESRSNGSTYNQNLTLACSWDGFLHFYIIAIITFNSNNNNKKTLVRESTVVVRK